MGRVSIVRFTYRPPLQGRYESYSRTVAVSFVAARPVVPVVFGYTDFAGSRENAPPAAAELHEPLTLGRLRTTPRPLLHTTG